MRLPRTVLVVGVMTMVSAASADVPWRAAEQLDLVPTPQQIGLDGGELDLIGWKIVVASDCRMAALGAEEINDRITALGGEALARGAAFPADGGAIVIGPCTDGQVAAVAEESGLRITPDDPGPQGYAIKCGVRGAQPLIACVGSDDLGALYACVTLRRMIQRRDDRVVALCGSVRDWPDFRWRCNGRVNLGGIARVGNSSDDAVADVKSQIDFFLRHKVNHLSGRLRTLAADEHSRSRQKEVVQYAADRGIHLRFIGGTDIESYLSKEQKQQAFEPRKNRFYMWSALDAHRRKAQHYAETLQDVQAGMLALHPVDSGAYIDPEKWSMRPDPDRARYDDRAAASIEQFKLYFDTIRKHSPGTLLEAVSYPYQYQFALPDFPKRFQQMNVAPYPSWCRRIEDEQMAREVQRRLIDYHRRVSEALDPSVFVTFREAGRDIFLACAKLYKGHPVTIWTYPETYQGWHGTFSPQARYAKSFVREDYDDYFFMAKSPAGARDSRAQYLAHAEYIWNSDVPDGADDFTVSSRLYQVGGQVTDYQRESLVPRIARILYGGAAPEMAQVMAANVSLNYVAVPKSVTSTFPRGEGVDDPYLFMADQADKFRRLSGLLQDLMDRAETGQVAGVTAADIRDDESFGWVVFFFKYCRLAAVKARLEAQADRCRKLLAAGKAEEAAELAAEARAGIPGMAAACQQVRKRSAASGVSVPSGGPTGKTLDTFDPSAFEELFAKIETKAADQK